MLAYVGNFRPHWSTENYVRRSFEDIGEQVMCLQEDEVSSDQVIEWCGRYRPEWLLYTRTWGLKDGREGGFRLFESLARKWIPTATLSLDLYWGTNREQMIRDEPMWRTSVVFTADGGRDEDFKREGVNHHWLPPAVYAGDCFRGKMRLEYCAKVAFVGSFQSYHKEWPFRQELVNALRREHGIRFAQWGDANWIRGHDLNDLFASATIIVGDSIARPKYWSDRIPETIGRGGFLLAPMIEGMVEEGFHMDPQVVERSTIAYYAAGSVESCMAASSKALRDDFPREAISERGMELVKSKHTYAHRCRAMLDAVRRYRDGWTRAADHLG